MIPAQPEQFAYRLLDIQVPTFDLVVADWSDHDEVLIGAKLEWFLLPAERRITASLLLGHPSAEQNLLRMSVQCVFEIEENTWAAVCELAAKQVAFPRPFLLQLGNITVGTTRGILHEKTSNMGISPLLLPLLDVGKLLPDVILLTWE